MAYEDITSLDDLFSELDPDRSQRALDLLHSAQELARNRARQGTLKRSDEMEAAIIDARMRSFQASRREQMLQR